MCWCLVTFVFFTQKTAYEMRMSDWSSDVCSSDLIVFPRREALIGGKGDLLDQPPAAGEAAFVRRIFHREARRVADRRARTRDRRRAEAERGSGDDGAARGFHVRAVLFGVISPWRP